MRAGHVARASYARASLSARLPSVRGPPRDGRTTRAGCRLGPPRDGAGRNGPRKTPRTAPAWCVLGRPARTMTARAPRQRRSGACSFLRHAPDRSGIVPGPDPDDHKKREEETPRTRARGARAAGREVNPVMVDPATDSGRKTRACERRGGSSVSFLPVPVGSVPVRSASLRASARMRAARGSASVSEHVLSVPFRHGRAARQNSAGVGRARSSCTPHDGARTRPA